MSAWSLVIHKKDESTTEVVGNPETVFGEGFESKSRFYASKPVK